MKKITFKQVDEWSEYIIYAVCALALGYFIGRIVIFKN